MGAKYKIALISVFIVLFISGSCIFKSPKHRGVMSYRHGKVFLQYGGYYRVGELPGGWRRLDSDARAITWYNENYKASISTDAFCGKSFSDRPLDTLGGELASALSNDRKTTSAKDMTLDGRGALRLAVAGTLDGVAVNMDIVVVKKDGCNFDFYAVMPPDAPYDVTSDFEEFFKGFHY